mgnify:FL=1
MDVTTSICYFGSDTDFMSWVEAFASGFCLEGELTEEEVKAIPLLLRLRLVSAFITTYNWYSTEKSEPSLSVRRLWNSVLK